MTKRNLSDELKKLPPIAEALFKQLEARQDAQVEVMAWLLLDLQAHMGLPNNHFQNSLARFSKELCDSPKLPEHKALADELSEMLDALQPHSQH